MVSRGPTTRRRSASNAIVVPDFELTRERGIVNTREVVRFHIEGLSLQLPHHKRVLSFDIWRDPRPRTTTCKFEAS